MSCYSTKFTQKRQPERTENKGHSWKKELHPQRPSIIPASNPSVFVSPRKVPTPLPTPQRFPQENPSLPKEEASEPPTPRSSPQESISSTVSPIAVNKISVEVSKKVIETPRSPKKPQEEAFIKVEEGVGRRRMNSIAEESNISTPRKKTKSSVTIYDYLILLLAFAIILGLCWSYQHPVRLPTQL
jgi:hypothetical protein